MSDIVSEAALVAMILGAMMMLTAIVLASVRAGGRR